METKLSFTNLINEAGLRITQPNNYPIQIVNNYKYL